MENAPEGEERQWEETCGKGEEWEKEENRDAEEKGVEKEECSMECETEEDREGDARGMRNGTLRGMLFEQQLCTIVR